MDAYVRRDTDSALGCLKLASAFQGAQSRREKKSSTVRKPAMKAALPLQGQGVTSPSKLTYDMANRSPVFQRNAGQNKARSSLVGNEGERKRSSRLLDDKWAPKVGEPNQNQMHSCSNNRLREASGDHKHEIYQVETVFRTNIKLHISEKESFAIELPFLTCRNYIELKCFELSNTSRRSVLNLDILRPKWLSKIRYPNEKSGRTPMTRTNPKNGRTRVPPSNRSWVKMLCGVGFGLGKRGLICNPYFRDFLIQTKRKATSRMHLFLDEAAFRPNRSAFYPPLNLDVEADLEPNSCKWLHSGLGVGESLVTNASTSVIHPFVSRIESSSIKRFH
ncbi:uncharacterized protein BDR25DRAFT_361523 [Lindgomyces ingoldianus]|uniref:Uncharacterized protein n=1 Tax=Lindgomyces ingoldianus TaxID=673940 RepID=A0ACB6QDL4_9PLEO|nr:uncharacterized protein BDR25DRAFT_361523 [Lindgomyces ingoldianus]KAF2464457.1 hypothetical protein BDR25DRAFT_361523 [Lindgomyces ingoldianus]